MVQSLGCCECIGTRAASCTAQFVTDINAVIHSEHFFCCTSNLSVTNNYPTSAIIDDDYTSTTGGTSAVNRNDLIFSSDNGATARLFQTHRFLRSEPRYQARSRRQLLLAKRPVSSSSKASEAHSLSSTPTVPRPAAAARLSCSAASSRFTVSTLAMESRIRPAKRSTCG